jgi:leader peptidase (prepilin peptidase)/N-methyltransferase
LKQLLRRMLITPIDAAVAVWLLALGGAVGSFLNVVVYRLPAGLSLAWPGSHCPKCKHPIRWYDNMPVIGWFALGGRCRDCHLPISFRYPLVEALTALLYLALGLTELWGRAGNLPTRPVLVTGGLAFPPLGFGELAGILAYHLLLLCVLLAATLIQYDGYTVPGRLVIPVLAVGILGPMMWPNLRPVPALSSLNNGMAGFTDGVAGGVAGLLAGIMLGSTAPVRLRGGTVALLGCVGVFLGWQAIVVLAPLGVLGQLLTRGLVAIYRPAEGTPPLVWIALGALGWILLWRPLVELCPFLG